MEHRYKDALRELYKLKLTKNISADYREHLFGLGWFYKPIAVEVSPEEKNIPVEKLEKTEKKQVLESFNEFGNNLLGDKLNARVILDNIEISKKTPDLISQDDSLKNVDFSGNKTELQAELFKILGEESTKARYLIGDVNRFSLETVKVIFIADTLLENSELEGTELDEFLALFDKGTSELFSKMVKAMKLNKEDYLLSAITSDALGDEKGNFTEYVLKEVLSFRPKLIITLGVSASHALLDTKDRLQNLHGNFYPLKLKGFETEVMPLFSPSLLRSAPHMKSVTWVDMQKAMEKLV